MTVVVEVGRINHRPWISGVSESGETWNQRTRIELIVYQNHQNKNGTKKTKINLKTIEIRNFCSYLYEKPVLGPIIENINVKNSYIHRNIYIESN